MHRSQAICFACRRQRAVVSSSSCLSNLYRWQSRAFSSSATTQHERNTSSSAYDYLSTLDEPYPDEPQPDRQEGPATSPKTRFRVSRDGRRKIDQDQARSIDVFQKAVNRYAHQNSPAVKDQNRSPGQIDFFNNLERFTSMMKNESLERCFEFFLDRLWRKTDYRRITALKNHGTELLRKVAEEKAKDIYNAKWPSFAQIVRMQQDMGALNVTKMADMVLGFIENIIASSSPQREDSANDEAYQKYLARKDELLEDLVDTWIVFSLNGLNSDSSYFSTPQEAQFRLPPINETQLQGFAENDDVWSAMGLIFAQPIQPTEKNLYAAALASFVLLVDPAHSSPSIRHKAQPFLVSVGRVLSAVKIKHAALTELFKLHPTVFWFVMESWTSLISQLYRPFSTPRPVASTLATRISSGQVGTAIADRSLQQGISNALLMGNANSLERIWLQFWGEGDMPDEERINQMLRQPALFNSFIAAFTALHRPQRALDVWSAMTRIGIKATLKTWTSMIQGFRKARNPVALEGVWKKLIASGAQLDEKIWRARISGLMECREPEAGLQALKELANQSKRPGGVPLTIGAVNAVITGLLRLSNLSAAKDVLQWASRYGLSPDIVTYNLFLRPLLRDGQTAQAQDLLQLMRHQGIHPDAATFSTLLDGVIVAIRDQTPEQKMSTIMSLLDSMTNADVKVTVDILGRLIHLLLSEGQHTQHHTQGIVGAVLKYAELKGLRLSRHIYTMLVNYYFLQDPPAIEEVNNLLMDPNGLLLAATGDLDRVFWERVIRGFASSGKADLAWGLFQQVHNLGTALTLDCLEEVLRCIVGHGMMAEAGKLVATVANDRRTMQLQRGDDAHARFWRHGFWGFAKDCNLFTSAMMTDV